MVKANCCTCDENLLLSSTHSLQEGNEGHEAFIVGGLAELLHQGLGLLLGQLLSEVGQKSEQLVGQHGVVVVHVVQLQDLNEVVEASLVLGVLAGLVHGEHVGLYSLQLRFGHNQNLFPRSQILASGTLQ